MTNTLRSARTVVSTFVALATLIMPYAGWVPLAHAADLFSDGFETSNFSLWTSATGNWDNQNGDVHSGSRKAEIGGDTGTNDDVLQKDISTVGYGNIILSYWRKITGNLESSDHIYVEWSTDGTNWTIAKDFTNINSGNWIQESHTLLAGAFNAAGFRFRFRAHLSSNSDELRLDDVLLTGDVLAAPKLTVTKIVVNDNGGTSVVGNFPLFVDDTSVISGIQNTFTAGVHSVSETGATGYTAIFSGDCVADGTITLSAGDVKSCTITNNDQQAYVIVDKTVINDNGGTATADDFLLTVDGSAVSDGVAVPVIPGTHIAGETNLPGYAVGVWGGDCNTQGSVTVALGETKICTITNNDQSGTLTITKVVVGQGDQDVFDFSIPGATPNTAQITGNGTTQVSVNAGAYTVTEAQRPEYDLPSYSPDCTGTMGLGDSKICTVTNTKLGRIMVVKEALGGNGDDEFPFTANFIPNQFSLTDHSQQSSEWLTSGTYTVVESQLPIGWDLVSATCSDGSDPAAIDLSTGEQVTCTFTNVKRGSLTIQKLTDPDEGMTFDFTLASSSLAYEQTQPVENEGEINFPDLKSGSYSLTETLPEGWEGQQLAVCNNDQTFDLAAGSHDVVIAPGQNVTCIINNTEFSILGGAKFNDLNANGQRDEGELGISGWTIELWQGSELAAEPVQTDDNGEFLFGGLLPAFYRLCERPQDGWVQTSPTGFQGPVCQYGENIFTNGWQVELSAGQTELGKDFGNFQLGSISGIKYEDLNGNGERDENESGLAEWTIYLDTNHNNILDEGELFTVTDFSGFYSFGELEYDTFMVREVQQAGWTQSQPQEPNYYEVTMTSGTQAIDRDFGNFRQPLLTVRKVVVGGSLASESFDLFVDGEPVSHGVATGFLPGTYPVTESPNDPHYQASYSETCANGSVTLVSGTEVTCTITNTFIPEPVTTTISGHKWNDLDGDGVWDENELGIEGWNVLLGRRMSCGGEEQPVCPENEQVPIEIIALELTGNGGQYDFPVTEPGRYYLLEESRNGWTPTHPGSETAIDSFFDITYRIDGPQPALVNSFFDVFVEMGEEGLTLQPQGPFEFGNHQQPQTSPTPEPTQTPPPSGGGGGGAVILTEFLGGTPTPTPSPSVTPEPTPFPTPTPFIPFAFGGGETAGGGGSTGGGAVITPSPEPESTISPEPSPSVSPSVSLAPTEASLLASLGLQGSWPFLPWWLWLILLALLGGAWWVSRQN